MLKVGDKAPDFTGVDQSGNEIKLEDFKGKKLILYFYPKDNTPGCTKQACNLRDNYQELLKQGYEVLGVCADSTVKHTKFRTKYQLPFALVADTEKEIIKKYGIWGKKKFMGRESDGLIRTTFVIDRNGIIE